jgi:hypothetical protein
LAAIGLWYDDYTGGPNPVTQDLLDVLTYTTGVETNDTLYKSSFPYVQAPWSGFGKCGGPTPVMTGTHGYGMNIGGPGVVMAQNFPNPVKDATTIRYTLSSASRVSIEVYDVTGKKIAVLVNNEMKQSGTYDVKWNAEQMSSGTYIAVLSVAGDIVQSMKMNVSK